MSTLMERLDKLKALIQDPDFLDGKGLSNEVNIRIFCYDPKEEMAVRYFTEKLMCDQDLNCHLIEYNLYKTLIAICDKRHITDKIPGIESKKGKKHILDQLRGVQGKDGPAGIKAFIQEMQYAPHERGDVILITGVGEAFPFIRVHALLDAMQPSFPDVPVLVMYPGSFDGRYVKLFDKLMPNPYYRAFNVI